MWTYYQSSGVLVDASGTQVAKGYSGALPDGFNNPALQEVHNVGPLPQGAWTIEGPPVDTATHGPYVLRLAPQEGTEVFGRSGFLIHGDEIGNPGYASHGCLIFPHFVRQMIWESGDRELNVEA